MPRLLLKSMDLSKITYMKLWIQIIMIQLQSRMNKEKELICLLKISAHIRIK